MKESRLKKYGNFRGAGGRLASVRAFGLFGLSVAVLGTAQAQVNEPLPETPGAANTAPGMTPVTPQMQPHSTQAQTPPAETEAAPKRVWTITPRITLAETLTDNVLLRDSNKRSDQITEISPGIRISGESARLKAYFDYSLRELLYAHDSSRKNNQNALNTFGTLQAVEHLLYVDFSGVIAQQQISALGVQSPSYTNVNVNQTETSNFRLSPYLKGKFLGSAEYELRYAANIVRSDSAAVSDLDQSEWSAHLKGATPFSRLQWAVDASRLNLDYSRGRRTEATRLDGRLSYMFDNSLRLTGIFGQEENNYLTLDQERHTTNGYGIDWTPSPTTKLSFDQERRFFGNGHHLNFEHRTPRTALIYSDSRDVSTTPSNLYGGSVGNVYDLMFNQMASLEPDPVKRAALVNNFLQASGIAPNTSVTSGFLNSGPTVSRNQNLSFALIGVRNTLTLIASQSDTQRIGLMSAVNEDLASATRIRQRGLSISLAHKLTPLTNLNLMASRQNSFAASTNIETNTRQLTATLSSRFGTNVTGSLGLRHVVFESPVTPYTENAFVGTLNLQY